MKQIVCEKPYRFKMTDVKMPELKDGEALVRIKRIGICGTDFHAYCGRQPFFSYPRVLGHELSGEIVSIDNSGGTLAGRSSVNYSLFGMRGMHRLPERTPQLLRQSERPRCPYRRGMREYINVPADDLLKQKD